MTAYTEIATTLNRKIAMLKELTADTNNPVTKDRLTNKIAGVETGLYYATSQFEEFADHENLAFNNTAFLLRRPNAHPTKYGYQEGIELALETIKQEWEIASNA